MNGYYLNEQIDIALGEFSIAKYEKGSADEHMRFPSALAYPVHAQKSTAG